MDSSTKRVFLSYSWAVQERVIELAERLIANGIDVILDVYDLKEGQDKYAFMEQSVNDTDIDRVLIICDKTYTEKANDRSGGVGDETVIISPEIYGSVNQEKFIPVIFEADENGHPYRPSYIKSRIYIDLSTEDNRYESEYEKLLRNIYEKPLYKKPAIGTKPEWLENDVVDLSSIRDIIKQVRGYIGGNTAKADFLLRKATDEFVTSAKLYVLPENKPIEESMLAIIDQTKSFRDLFIEYCEALIYASLPVNETLSSLFERLFNELHDATGKQSYSSSDFELYDFMVWELFVSTAATLLHYEKYLELHLLLRHTYFLKTSYYDTIVAPFSYFNFQAYMQTVEGRCKAKYSQRKLYTITGDILVKREKKPILTTESLSNADIVLYQLGTLLNLPPASKPYWFPKTYVYHQPIQVIWQKLKSREYCKKILPLFGVDNITEFKKLIEQSTTDREVCYNNCFESAPGILTSIALDEIGTLN